MWRLNLHTGVTQIYGCKVKKKLGHLQFVMSNIIGQYFAYFVRMFAYLNALNLKNDVLVGYSYLLTKNHAKMS